MKAFRNLAVIAAVVGISHSMAGNAFASDWQPAEAVSPPVEPPVVMSAEELAVIEGGLYFGRPTRNQVLITAAAAVSGFAIGGIQIAVKPSNVGAQIADLLVCKGFFGTSAALLGQSQISAGRIDNRNLGSADFGIAVAHVAGLGALSWGCSELIEKVLVRNAEDKAREIVNNKNTSLANAAGLGGRKLLQDRWDENDRWFDWALDNAQTARDTIEVKAREIIALKDNRPLCWGAGIFAAHCFSYYDALISGAHATIKNQIYYFQNWTAEMAKVLKYHAGWVGMQVPPANKTGGTYEIR